jgi:tetratricopeptide (TPR) repeat protein
MAEHVRSSADEQLIDQARALHAKAMNCSDLATEGVWVAHETVNGLPPNNYWAVTATRTPTTKGVEPFTVWKAHVNTPSMAGLLTFVSTGLPQLCDLADRALAAEARATKAEGERDRLISAVGEHVTVRGEYLARAQSSELVTDDACRLLYGKDLARTVDDRDAAEQALSQAYFLVTGRSPQWSSVFGRTEAVADIDDAQSSLRQALQSLEADRDRLKEALEPFAKAAELLPPEVDDLKVVAHVPAGPHAEAYRRVGDLLMAAHFRRARSALQPIPAEEA